MNKPLVCIIIINWNNATDTIECLKSVSEQKYKNFKVIIVDNNSSDNSFEEIESYLRVSNFKYNVIKILCERYNYKEFCKSNFEDKDIILIRNVINAGFAGANNLGIELAMNVFIPKFVWLLNNDTVVKEDILLKLIDCDRKFPRSIIGSKIFYYYEKNKIQTIGGWLNLKGYFRGKSFGNNIYDDGNYERILEPDYINGASMFMSTEVLKEVGKFDEKFFLYWEETDFCVRAKKCGWKMIYCPEAIVWHKEGATTKKVSYLPLYYYTRNSLYFYKKNDKGKFPIIFLAGYLYKIFKRMIIKDYISISYINKAYGDFILNRFGKANFN